MSLEIVPLTIGKANELVGQWHRHHKPTVSGLFAVGVSMDGSLVGAAIVGRPSARNLQDGWTAEVTRCVTNGTPHACSALYGAARRAARALGYRRLLTYTLPEEGGASLRGAGWVCDGEAGGGSWSRENRKREDRHPTGTKYRWQALL